uniref:WAPL domain-containing protein n=1 Tax=Rhabditophanes sp. KR3021 TaxID=114890 RepID=A0AC35UBP2_9BILA
MPCKETYEDENDCILKTCSNAFDTTSCNESCQFLVDSTNTKPGSCPIDKKSQILSECKASCSKDSDCENIQKCCTIGCSRICKKPKMKDARLLPIPNNIVVVERKRKRSAVVRWVMKGLTRNHTNTNSNIYVIQWKWGLEDKESKMTQWQTVTMKNKNYAILKHVLSAGRYYIFRVGAVSELGSLGYSNCSNAFKLSKEAKAPSGPTNVTAQVSDYDKYSYEWSYKVTWIPPHSDLPVKEYHLSYWESDVVTPDMMRSDQQKRSLTDTDGSDEMKLEERNKVTIIIPNFSTKAEISKLKCDKNYIIEIYGTSESSEGLLKGDVSTILIKTNKDEREREAFSYVPHHIPVTISNNQIVKSFKAEIGSPYFEVGSLHTSISWEDHPLCSPVKRSFLVKVSSISCESEMIKLTTSDCSISVGDLKFDCEYEVEVREQRMLKNVLKNTFYTYSCNEVNGMTDEMCESYEKNGIVCLQKSSNSMSCSWGIRKMRTSSETLVGYRINLSSRNAPSNLSILPPSQRSIIFKDLSNKTAYLLKIQCVTSQGLGEEMESVFQTNDYVDDSSDTVPILELPLSSSSSLAGRCSTFALIISLMSIL